jgi:hydrogenase maturation protease
MIVIIGYGNSLRGDDGAGLIFARWLAARWRQLGLTVEDILTQELLPELACKLAQPEAEAILFIDTGFMCHTPAIQRVPDVTEPAFGHTSSPAILLHYAKGLYGHCAPAWLLTLPGVRFEHSEALSLVARQGMVEAQKCLETWEKNTDFLHRYSVT